MKNSMVINVLTASVMALTSLTAHASSLTDLPNPGENQSRRTQKASSSSTEIKRVGRIEIEIQNAQSPLVIQITKMDDCGGSSCWLKDKFGTVRFKINPYSNLAYYLASSGQAYSLNLTEDEAKVLKQAGRAASENCPVEIKLDRERMTPTKIKFSCDPLALGGFEDNVG